MIKQILLILCIGILPVNNSFAQKNVNYNDVGIIYNVNDSGSIRIANYFIARRNIPQQNLIPINVPAVEEISDSVFRVYVSQVQSYLSTNNLDTALNYLVTTKGCPLKVLRANPDTNNCNASIESELMLLPPAHNSYIGGCSTISQINSGQYFVNPYYLQSANFTRANYGIYLVTRLDAYTIQNVFDLIDSSGPNTYVNKDTALFVLDQSPNWAGNSLNNAMSSAASLLTSRGWHVKLNTDSVFVTNQNHVLGYASWGSNDGFSDYYTQHAIPHNTWLKGSIAETCVSTSGRSFQPGTTYGQSLIADLLNEGATGAKGYVYEPYTIAIASAYNLFNRYTNLLGDGTPVYNLAESYFSASRMISWMDVVIGDPKTSITTSVSVAVKEIENHSFSIYPNPASDILHVKNLTNVPGLLQIFNQLGQLQYQLKYPAETVSLNISEWSKGVYLLKIFEGQNLYCRRVVVE